MIKIIPDAAKLSTSTRGLTSNRLDQYPGIHADIEEALQYHQQRANIIWLSFLYQLSQDGKSLVKV